METKSYLLLIFILLLSCQSKEKSIISAIEKKCGITYTCADEGEYNLYSITVSKGNYYSTLGKAKNTIDKEMDALPTISIVHDVSAWGNSIYSHYEWETPKMKVVLEGNDELGNPELKFWIILK